MASYDYKVIPAPTKGTKVPGVKSAEGRFAATIEGTLNAQAAEGWEYFRTDILPSDERQGLTGSQTVYRTLMVFRRAKIEGDKSAEDVIQTAQNMAETALPDTKPEAEPALTRRTPAAAPVTPSRGDPAPKPDVPETPETPDSPDTPDDPKKD